MNNKLLIDMIEICNVGKNDGWTQINFVIDKLIPFCRDNFKTLLNEIDNFKKENIALKEENEKLKTRIVELESKYNDLIYCVGKKHSSESRHDTARRYIIEREQRDILGPYTLKKDGLDG